MERDYMQTVKMAMILCSCFFAYGTCWSDWAFDYYLLWANPLEHPEAVTRATFYYANQANISNIIKYVPIANLCIASIGFAMGLFTMTDGNYLFDGASLVLMLFGISTYIASVKPAIHVVNESVNVDVITTSLRNIAAAHFIIVLAITGIIGLQVAHYFVMKRSSGNKFEDDGVVVDDDDDDDDEQDVNE